MPDFDPALPFVLLDDASRGGSARLFTGLTAEIVARTPADVRPALERLRGPGTYAGFIGFEAGYALEPVLAPLARAGDDGLPLLWFGEFAESAEVDAAALLGDGAARMGALAPAIAEADYAAMLGQAAALIAAGDIYQANLTFAAQVGVAGSPARHLPPPPRRRRRAVRRARLHRQRVAAQPVARTVLRARRRHADTRGR